MARTADPDRARTGPGWALAIADLSEAAGVSSTHLAQRFKECTRLTPTRYIEVRMRFLREHPGHVLDSWPLPAA